MKMFLTILTLLIVFMFIKNNITPKNMGVRDGKLAKMPNSPNAVSSQTDIENKKVEPLKFSGDLEATRSKIIKIVNNYEGTDIIINEKNYIYAVFTTGGMKFKDDVEFYFDEDTNLIHYRSASRVGYSDMGLNKKRFNEIQKYYDEI